MIYVYLDTSKTQEYVFSSRRLRGIRNASRAIDKCDEEVGEFAAGKGEKIRALGGVVIAAFDDDKCANDFLHEAHHIYDRYGISFEFAKRTCCHPGNFYYDALSPLLKETRKKKDCPKRSALASPSTILAATCETSGRGSAQALVQAGPDVCRANASEQKKWQMPKRDRIAEELVGEWTQAGVPDTFEGIVGWSKSEKIRDKDVPGTSEERLLGLVFADVNGLGSLLEHVAKDKAKLNKFAPALKNCLIESLKSATKKELKTAVASRIGEDHRSGRTDTAVPFRLLFLGGDDLCFAVIGPYTLPLVKHFIECFEKLSRNILNSLDDTGNLPSNLTISAGVVIAPYNYPILSFRRLGRDLESHTKRIGRAWASLNRSHYPPSLVDFYLVKNDVSGTLENVRASAYAEFDHDKVAQFGGPYLVSERNPHPASTRFLPLGNLLEAAEKLSLIPASGKLRALPQLLTTRSRLSAGYLYAEWWDHLDDNEQQWKDICGKLGVPDKREELPIQGYPVNNTPVFDALQLAPFARLRKRWES